MVIASLDTIKTLPTTAGAGEFMAKGS